jgi:tetratricopeptide (TPR) repeat protein
MLLSWLNAQEAVAAGNALADSFPVRKESQKQEVLSAFLQNAENELSSLKLNFYKRARFANAFKWRLLENGVQAELAAELTQTLLIASTVGPTGSTRARAPAPNNRPASAARKPRDADALNDQGSLYLSEGKLSEAEKSLRHALRLKPSHLMARGNLALVLTAQDNRLVEARTEAMKVLKVAPSDTNALYALGIIEMTEGRFAKAEDCFKKSLAANPDQPRAWSAMAGLQKMTTANKPWLKRAEQLASSDVAPTDQIHLRFAIGKYYDDIGEYAKAFSNFERGNELLKTTAPPYDHAATVRLVDDMIRTYTPETLARVKSESVSDSIKPILVIGMPRSGTSLTEQILASHPAVRGAGELAFWHDMARKHGEEERSGLLSVSKRKKLADEYLRTLARHCPDAQRVVDKAPMNSEHLGLFHSAFPRAKIIYMRRDPIDTCLSCYFQPFFSGLNYTYDLSDLASYYNEHARLMAHWRSVLPSGCFLEVPYADLVTRQEHWTSKMLEFLELDWDQRCLRFHETQRAVGTASRWQVRQPMYRDSLQRSRNYTKFIGPLRNLKSA